ncbi:hypothetical protein Trydic_g5418 [Trypoxylus dichotomus]
MNRYHMTLTKSWIHDPTAESQQFSTEVEERDSRRELLGNFFDRPVSMHDYYQTLVASEITGKLNLYDLRRADHRTMPSRENISWKLSRRFPNGRFYSERNNAYRAAAARYKDCKSHSPNS